MIYIYIYTCTIGNDWYVRSRANLIDQWWRDMVHMVPPFTKSLSW